MAETAEELVGIEMKQQIKILLKEMSIKNYTIDISEGSLIGDNYLGRIAKVVVRGENTNGQQTSLNLIVKSAPQNETFRSLTPIRQAYNREIYLYSTVFPQFEKFQKKKAVEKPFNSFPKFYGSSMNDMKEALIMEDMKVLGFELRNRHETLNIEHVLLVMRTYGKLHAISYALRDQEPEVFQELARNTQDLFMTELCMIESFRTSVDQYSNKALKSLDPVQHTVAYNKFKIFQEKMADCLVETTSSEIAGNHGVISHGDCWMNNILFNYKDSTNRQSPSEICILDWQLSRLASPVLDLSYFIFTCTSQEIRDEHYDHFIQEYYNSLSSYMIELGSDPEKMLPFKVLQEHLTKFSVFGLAMSVILIYLMTSEVEEIPDIHNLTNVDELTDMFNNTSKNEEQYQSRVRGVIMDFIKYGYEF